MCEQKLTRHKWADVLIAIAEGREFQIYSEHAGQWQDWNPSLKDPITFPKEKFRVKPKILRKYSYAYECKNGLRNVTPPHYLNDEDFMNRNYVDKMTWFQRLDNSCVEVEES